MNWTETYKEFAIRLHEDQIKLDAEREEINKKFSYKLDETTKSRIYDEALETLNKMSPSNTNPYDAGSEEYRKWKDDYKFIASWFASNFVSRSKVKDWVIENHFQIFGRDYKE